MGEQIIQLSPVKNMPGNDDGSYSPKAANILHRICVQKNQVRCLSRLDGAKLPLNSKKLSGAQSGSLQRLHRGRTG